MYKLLHQIFGAYTLLVPKKDSIKLINILKQKKILFWGIKNAGDVFHIKASLFTCESCIRIAAENGIKVTILKTTGFPFVFSKYKGRYGLILGSLIGIFLIFASQLFVWEITIIGNEKISDAIIINTLAKYGVSEGAYIPDIDVSIIEQQLLIENTDLSSISINIKGSIVEIDLLERTYPPDIAEANEYFNLVASDDGIIIRVEAINGSPEVKVGDVVVKGQILVNAFMRGRFDTDRLTHACGEVYARVIEKYSITIPLEQTEKIFTGKTETITSTDILGHSFDFFNKNETSFVLYDTTVLQSDKTILGLLKTPVTVTIAEYQEYEMNQYTIHEEEAKKRASEAFVLYLDRLEHEIISYDCDGYYDKENNAYVFTASVVILKNIAVEQKIDIIG